MRTQQSIPWWLIFIAAGYVALAVAFLTAPQPSWRHRIPSAPAAAQPWTTRMIGARAQERSLSARAEAIAIDRPSAWPCCAQIRWFRSLLPSGYETHWIEGMAYYYANGADYVWHPDICQYQLVRAPAAFGHGPRRLVRLPLSHLQKNVANVARSTSSAAEPNGHESSASGVCRAPPLERHDSARPSSISEPPSMRQNGGAERSVQSDPSAPHEEAMA